ncbi:MAG: serine/threonine protein kinase [Xanthomonadales bacterium]|nr:serine/threonine protein kinase [Xanthomonadales bacterium]
MNASLPGTPAAAPENRQPALAGVGLEEHVTALGSAAPGLQPLEPQLGPNYRVERLLGSGGMGAVWLARWRQADVERPVAVKVLLAGRDSSVAAQRFQRERRILARLQHPGIARLLDVGTTSDGRLFLTMDYIAGHMLLEHVRAERPDIATRLRLLVEIAEAVAFAHRNFVVHRDLKPLNVIVDREGHPHLLDFGIARLLGDSDEETLTATGVRPLSPGYAAPEQLRGDDVGTAADVYALGVIGYELLCGARPFERQGGLERILRDLVSERLRTPSEVVATTLGDEALRPPLQRKRLARELQGDLDTILVRALAAQPERRYATASDLADDLVRYLDGQPIRARPDTGWYRLRKFVSRHRTVVAIAGSALLALVLGLLVALAQARRASIERDRALAARDFMLGMVQSANPYQAPNPALRVDVMFEHAARNLVGRFPNDPEMEATLLQQFGRSLLVLERGDAAAEALQRAERLLAGQVPDTHALLVEVRGRLVDLYRLQRNFARSGALAEAQFALCDKDSVLQALQCLGIRNDRIETRLFSGHPARALLQVQEARAFATAAQLDDDYESVFVDYLDGMARRQLGDTGAAADAFLRLAERTLATVPSRHPGLLTDMMWLGAIALDLGNTELAERCVEHALAGRSALYAPGSRYVHEARLLRAQVAVAASDPVRARSELSTILAFRDAQHGSESTPMTLAATWLALLDAVPAADSRTAAGAGGAVLNVDDNSARAAELRLLQALIAITRGDLATARRLHREVDDAAERAPIPHWRPLADLVAARIADAVGDTATALALRARIDTELGRQGRRLFDPVAGRWLGAKPAEADAIAARLQAVATRIATARQQPF